MAPKKSWQVSSRRMLGLIGLCAFIGFEISCYVNLPLSLKVILAFVICQIIYLYSGTNFTPMISAMVLPVLMGTESMIYPVTAICLTGLIIIFEKFLIHQDYKQNMAFRPLPKPQAEDWKQLLLRCVIVSILVLLFVPMAMKCVVAPPYESVYRSKNQCIYGEETGHVKQFYINAGMELKEKVRVPEDFIGTELEFMYWMSHRMYQALQNGQEELAHKMAVYQYEFLMQHLLMWVPQFVKDVVEGTTMEYFRVAAAYLEEFLKEDVSFLESLK